MIPYVTLYQLRAELGLGATQTGDDALLSRHLRAGTGWIERQARRHFDPLRAERPYSAEAHRELLFSDDLLALVGLTNGDDAAIDADEYFLDPNGVTPYYGLHLRPSTTVSWKPRDGDYERNIKVDGVWGYHPRYADAWADTLETVLENPLASGATDITFSDADGIAADSPEPRIQAGNLIRFGPDDDDEMAQVVSVNYTTNAAVLARGAQGSTAAAQTQGTKIYVFRPWENAQRALIRIATFSYRAKDGKPTERVSVLGNTQQIVPGGIPEDVLDLLPVRPVMGAA